MAGSSTPGLTPCSRRSQRPCSCVGSSGLRTVSCPRNSPAPPTCCAMVSCVRWSKGRFSVFRSALARSPAHRSFRGARSCAWRARSPCLRRPPATSRLRRSPAAASARRRSTISGSPSWPVSTLATLSDCHSRRCFRGSPKRNAGLEACSARCVIRRSQRRRPVRSCHCRVAPVNSSTRCPAP